MQKLAIPPLMLSSQLEAELKEAACSRKRDASELLEEIVHEWLDRYREPDEEEDDSAHQERLRAEAMKFIGVIARDDLRAENAGAQVKAKLLRRYGR